ncbi:MAG: histidine kinase [Actinomycetota bacterium]|nr:histidine kinase [Actinomycetota bacterium]
MSVRPSVRGFGLSVTQPDESHRTGRAPRDWAVDALLFLLCIGFTALIVVDGTDRHLPPVTIAADAALGGLASLGLWWRRRWPVGFALVAGLFAIYSLSASGVALIALFTVAAHRRLGMAVLVAAGYALTSWLTLLVRPDVSPPNLLQSVLGVVGVVALLALGMFVRARRQLAFAERERAAAEQEFRVAQARQLERNRIAREMHDVLGHRLSLLSLQAGALELWPDTPPEEIARAAGVIRSTAHGALEDLREVIGVLRAARDDDRAHGVPERPRASLADLATFIEESRQAGMRVVLECEVTDLGAVPEAVARTAFRIVQEGLTNARKHADHAAVSVAVRGAAADGLTIEVRNPWPEGVARTTPIPGAGMGLVGLAERTALTGGRLEHGRTPEGEFRLSAWLPWPA